MNEKTDSKSMQNMYKNICSLMVVFWANVMNEQWQINNLISWKFLFKNPYVNPKKQFA